MRTALATDEPDPERRKALTVVASTLSAASQNVTYTTTPPVTTATFPQQVIGPWQCPECKVWNAPHVREHRCS